MTFQSTSDLFSNRSLVISDADVRHYIENFLRNTLRVDAVYCDVKNMGAIVKIRVNSPVIAQQVVLLTQDIRVAVLSDLGCDIGSVRAIVE